MNGKDIRIEMDITKIENHYKKVFEKEIDYDNRIKNVLAAKEYENVSVGIAGKEMEISFTCSYMPDITMLSEMLAIDDSFKTDYDIRIKNNSDDNSKRDITIEARSNVDFRSLRCISYLQNIFTTVCKLQGNAAAA